MKKLQLFILLIKSYYYAIFSQLLQRISIFFVNDSYTSNMLRKIKNQLKMHNQFFITCKFPI
jgi:hypothetical protein